MGEYWKPINVTKKEYVHPHDLDCGLKLGEWHYPGSPVHKRIDELIEHREWSEDDLIVIASDYGGLMPMHGTGEAPEELYELATETYRNVS